MVPGPGLCQNKARTVLVRGEYLMSEFAVHPVPEAWAKDAYIDKRTYDAMYRRSIEEPDQFWAEQAESFLTWEKPWHQVCRYDFRQGEAHWFVGGRLNVTVNCIDRHLETRGDQTAIIWEGDEPTVDKKITYRELYEHVCKLANALRSRGVKKGIEIGRAHV